MRTKVTIYTDGGCSPNPGTGGWAAILMHRDASKEISGGEGNTTNNRMELTAAVRALESLKRPCCAVLFTDSQYLKQGITAWLPSWKRRGWQRRGGQLKNIDLWQRLDQLTQVHEVEWRWIAGHSGDIHNERCDALVREAIHRQFEDEKGSQQAKSDAGMVRLQR